MVSADDEHEIAQPPCSMFVLTQGPFLLLKALNSIRLQTEPRNQFKVMSSQSFFKQVGPLLVSSLVPVSCAALVFSNVV